MWKRGSFHAKDTQIFSKLTAAVLAGAMLVPAGSFHDGFRRICKAGSEHRCYSAVGRQCSHRDGSTYANDIKAALDLVNQYRREACNNGYPNPENGKS